MQLLRWFQRMYALSAPTTGTWLPVLGVLLLLLAAGFAARSWSFARHRMRAVATVTENVPHFAAGGGILYYPRVRFRDGSGALVLVESKIGSEDAEFAAGETVPVLYLAGDPQHAVIATAWHLYPAAIWLGIIGTIVFDVGLLVLLGQRRQARLPA